MGVSKKKSIGSYNPINRAIWGACWTTNYIRAGQNPICNSQLIEREKKKDCKLLLFGKICKTSLRTSVTIFFPFFLDKNKRGKTKIRLCELSNNDSTNCISKIKNIEPKNHMFVTTKSYTSSSSYPYQEI